MRHIGEMPEQQTADLQILGQLQAQLQLEGEAVSRAESQRSLLESMMTQSAPVVDLDPAESDIKPQSPAQQSIGNRSQPANALSIDKANLAALLNRYKPNYPDVIRLKKKIEDEEAKAASSEAPAASAAAPAPPSTADMGGVADPAPPTRTVARKTAPPPSHFNPILQSQMKAADAEIAKHKEEEQRLAKLVGGYRGKLDAIPVREQEIASLTRDYEMSKTHYSQLLDRELSAETATQLEIRQKGEKFEVLDAALPAERPTSPKRMMINGGGAIAGLVLGLLLALATELLGMSITAAQDITDACSVKVLGVIPNIQTQRDKLTHRRLVVAGASATFAMLIFGAVLFLKYHTKL
jgi:hypothetical protein